MSQGLKRVMFQCSVTGVTGTSRSIAWGFEEQRWDKRAVSSAEHLGYFKALVVWHLDIITSILAAGGAG